MPHRSRRHASSRPDDGRDEAFSPDAYLRSLAERQTLRQRVRRKHTSKDQSLSLAERIVISKLDPENFSMQATRESALQEALTTAPRPTLNELIAEYRRIRALEKTLGQSMLDAVHDTQTHMKRVEQHVQQPILMQGNGDATMLQPINEHGDGDATMLQPSNEHGDGDATTLQPINKGGDADVSMSQPINNGDDVIRKEQPTNYNDDVDVSAQVRQQPMVMDEGEHVNRNHSQVWQQSKPSTQKATGPTAAVGPLTIVRKPTAADVGRIATAARDNSSCSVGESAHLPQSTSFQSPESKSKPSAYHLDKSELNGNDSIAHEQKKDSSTDLSNRQSPTPVTTDLKSPRDNVSALCDKAERNSLRSPLPEIMMTAAREYIKSAGKRPLQPEQTESKENVDNGPQKMSEEPTESKTTEAPTERNIKEDPTESNTTGELTERKISEEPTECKTTDDPTESKTTRELTEHNTAEDPTESNTTGELTERKTSEELTECKTTEDPTESKTTGELTEHNTTEDPIESNTTGELTERKTSEELTECKTTEDPTESKTTGELTEHNTTEELTERKTTGELTEYNAAEEPTERKTTGELTEHNTTEDPTESKTTGELTEYNAAEEPTERKTTGELIESKTREEPTERKTTKELTERSRAGELTESNTTGELTEYYTTEELTECKATEEPTELNTIEDSKERNTTDTTITAEEESAVHASNKQPDDFRTEFLPVCPSIDITENCNTTNDPILTSKGSQDKRSRNTTEEVSQVIKPFPNAPLVNNRIGENVDNNPAVTDRDEERQEKRESHDKSARRSQNTERGEISHEETSSDVRDMEEGGVSTRAGNAASGPESGRIVTAGKSSQSSSENNETDDATDNKTTEPDCRRNLTVRQSPDLVHNEETGKEFGAHSTENGLGALNQETENTNADKEKSDNTTKSDSNVPEVDGDTMSMYTAEQSDGNMSIDLSLTEEPLSRSVESSSAVISISSQEDEVQTANGPNNEQVLSSGAFSPHKESPLGVRETSKQYDHRDQGESNDASSVTRNSPSEDGKHPSKHNTYGPTTAAVGLRTVVRGPTAADVDPKTVAYWDMPASSRRTLFAISEEVSRQVPNNQSLDKTMKIESDLENASMRHGYNGEVIPVDTTGQNQSTENCRPSSQDPTCNGPEEGNDEMTIENGLPPLGKTPPSVKQKKRQEKAKEDYILFEIATQKGEAEKHSTQNRSSPPTVTLQEGGSSGKYNQAVLQRTERNSVSAKSSVRVEQEAFSSQSVNSSTPVQNCREGGTACLESDRPVSRAASTNREDQTCNTNTELDVDRIYDFIGISRDRSYTLPEVLSAKHLVFQNLRRKYRLHSGFYDLPSPDHSQHWDELLSDQHRTECFVAVSDDDMEKTSLKLPHIHVNNKTVSSAKSHRQDRMHVLTGGQDRSELPHARKSFTGISTKHRIPVEAADRHYRILGLYNDLKTYNVYCRTQSASVRLALSRRTLDLDMRIEWGRQFPEENYTLPDRHLFKNRDGKSAPKRGSADPDLKLPPKEINQKITKESCPAYKLKYNHASFIYLEDISFPPISAVQTFTGDKDLWWFLEPGTPTQRCNAGFSAGVSKAKTRKAKAWDTLKKKMSSKSSVDENPGKRFCRRSQDQTAIISFL